MILRWRGWISLDATGKFSSRWPFPDRSEAGSMLSVTVLSVSFVTSWSSVDPTRDIERNTDRNATPNGSLMAGRGRPAVNHAGRCSRRNLPRPLEYGCPVGELGGFWSGEKATIRIDNGP